MKYNEYARLRDEALAAATTVLAYAVQDSEPIPLDVLNALDRALHALGLEHTRDTLTHLGLVEPTPANWEARKALADDIRDTIRRLP